MRLRSKVRPLQMIFQCFRQSSCKLDLGIWDKLQGLVCYLDPQWLQRRGAHFGSVCTVRSAPHNYFVR